MYKIILFLFLLFISACSTPGSALLGPVFTGAKTGSAHQASLSFGTSQFINKIKDDFHKNKINFPDLHE